MTLKGQKTTLGVSLLLPLLAFFHFTNFQWPVPAGTAEPKKVYHFAAVKGAPTTKKKKDVIAKQERELSNLKTNVRADLAQIDYYLGSRNLNPYLPTKE